MRSFRIPVLAALTCALALAGCGSSFSEGDPVGWDAQQQTVARFTVKTTGSGLEAWEQSALGGEFVSIAGDGGLLYGSPHELREARLAPQQIESLLAAVDLDAFYALPPAIGERREGAELLTVSLTLDGRGTHEVSAHGLPAAELPGPLSRLLDGLRGVAEDGTALPPIGAVVRTEREVRADSRARQWPADLTLSLAAAEAAPGSSTRVKPDVEVTDVATVLRLVELRHPQNDYPVYLQNGVAYRLGLRLLQP